MRKTIAMLLLAVAALAGAREASAQSSSVRNYKEGPGAMRGSGAPAHGGLTLRFQVIEAGNVPKPPDPAIRDVQRALGELFRFQGYRLVAQGAVSVTEDSPFELLVSGDSSAYRIVGSTGKILGTGGLRRVELSVRLLVNGMPPSLSTSAVVPMGQTVLVGSSRPSPKGPTLILVMAPLAYLVGPPGTTR